MASALTYEIGQKATIAAAFVTIAGIEVDTVDFSLAPRLKQAQLVREFGVFRGDDITPDVDGQGNDKVFETRLPLDLLGKYIQVIVDDPTGLFPETWTGICVDQEDNKDHDGIHPVDGTAVCQGATSYTCLGLEYFLFKQLITTGRIASNKKVEKVLPFNKSGTRAQDRVGNRSTVKAIGRSSFDFATGTDIDVNEWTGLTVVEYLLELFELDHGITFTLGGQFAALDFIVGIWSFEGFTFYQALTEIINPNRGFTFYVDDQTIIVATTTDVVIGNIPANPIVRDIDFDQDEQLSRFIVNHVEDSHFDDIRVQGAPLRIMATLPVDGVIMDRDWTAAEEATYDALAVETQDRDLFENVYRRFKVLSTWDGKNGLIVVVPKINLGTAKPDESLGVQNIYWEQVEFERVLPRKQVSSRDFQRPLIFVTTATETTRLDKPSSGQTSSHIYPLDSGPGIQIQPPFPHYLGKNHHTGPGDTPLFDYTELKMTVSFRVCERIEYLKSSITPTKFEFGREKIIRVPEFETWFLADGTVFDVDQDAEFAVVGSSLLRDDSAKLIEIGDQAAIWYGQIKSTIDYVVEDPQITFPAIGDIIKSTNYCGTLTINGTIVSKVTYNFTNLTLAVMTEYNDLDFRNLTKRRQDLDKPGVLKELVARFEEVQNKIPMAQGSGGGAAAAATNQVVFVEVTTAVAFPGTMKVKVFGDGPDSPATLTNQDAKAVDLTTGDTPAVGSKHMAVLHGTTYYLQPDSFRE